MAGKPVRPDGAGRCQELRTPAEAAAAGDGHNRNGTQRDQEALGDILAWLRERFGVGART